LLKLENSSDEMNKQYFIIVGIVIAIALGAILIYLQTGEDISSGISEQKQCEMEGGLWGIWGNAVPVVLTCNPSTSDIGKECTDSSQCQSFCQAKEGAQIGIEDTGMCYAYELAICTDS